MYASINQYSEL